MEAKAIAKQIRISPQKARLVTRMIQGQNVSEALRRLKFSNKKAAVLVSSVLRSAMANAVVKGAADDTLKVKYAIIDEGPRLKRFRPASRGRAMRIIKRTAHISVTVCDQ